VQGSLEPLGAGGSPHAGVIKVNTMRAATRLAWGVLATYLLQAAVATHGLAQEAGSGEQRAEATSQAVDKHPLEPSNVLDEIIPQPDSVFDVGIPDSWFDFKDDVYEKYGLRFGFSYQLLAQYATDTLPDASFDTAVGDWWGFLGKWTMLNRGTENEGTLVFSMFERAAVGNNQVPAFFPLDTGSVTGNVEFTYWDFVIENLYWEQNFGFDKSKMQLRVGNQVVTTLQNPFRYKDSRVSFTTGPWAFHPTIPYPTFGFGIGIQLWPDKNSGFYVSGSINDMNSDPTVNGFDWSTLDEGQFYYGVEIGSNRVRSKEDYDHWHVLVFYADDRSSRSPDTLPNKAGGGIRIAGEKQWDRWVGYAAYTYNTAEGGGVTGTLADHVLTAGAAYRNPAGIRGEAAVSLLYMSPLEAIFADPVRDQYGIETYWRIKLTNNIWITPGIHLLFNPALNPDDDFIAIPQIKFRVAI
jgi:porin